MSVRFEIDKGRKDSFYHYKKYNDDSSICIKTGWGIWSKQESDEERTAWISAVQKYNKSRGVETKDNKIKEITKDIREKIKLDDTKIEGEKKPLIMPTIMDLIAAVKSVGAGECTDDYINKIMGLAPGGVPSAKAIFQYSWNAAWFNLEIDLQEMLMSFTKLGINGFVYPILDLVDEKSDELFATAYAVYDEVLRIAATAVYYYNKLVKIWGKPGKEDEAKKYKDKLIEELKALAKKFGDAIIEIIFQIFTIQIVIDMLQVIKSGYNSAESAWRGIINKVRALTGDDLKDMCRPCWEFLKSLLPMLAALAGAFIICKIMDKKEIEQSREMSAENLGVTPDDIERHLNSCVAAAQLKLSADAVVYNKALTNADGFALQAAGFGTVESLTNFADNAAGVSTPCDSNHCDCMVSLCNFSDPIDASTILARNTLEFPAGVVIEIQKNLPFSFTVSAGSEVVPGDIIAYIKDIPVKSVGGYKISGVYGNYFVAYETLDGSLADVTAGEDAEMWARDMLQKEIDSADLTEYNQIIDAYTRFSYADLFIRQYISYYRFPELAQFTREHVSGDVTELSADEFIEEYEKYADDYYKQYETNVRLIASKKRVKAAANRGKMSEITNALSDEKLNFKNNIINLYNSNPGGIKYCSRGRVADYMLYSNYLNYILSDRFEYDEDNPYIKELYECITDFIGTRARIELNADNIKPLYVKFNEYCARYIVNYWKVSNGNYYDYLCGLFKYDGYADTSDIIEDTTSTGMTLYKRVLKYLKSITKFSEDAAYSIEVDDNTDVTALIEEQGKKSSEESYSASNLEFERKLKQIAFRFAAIRRIELSLNNTNISANVSKQLKVFSALHTAVGDELYEYKSGKTYKKKDRLYGKGTIIEPVLKSLKEQTAREAARLREITDKCTKWYDENFESLMNGDIFDSLVEVPWPDPSTIYLDNSKMKYYLFTDDNVPPVTKAEREKLEDSIGEIPETGEIDVTDPKTAARIYDLKYWLKYCAIASITGAILPVFWATGIPIPIMLPIVYLPLVVVKGRVMLVAGLGICGMAVLPMLLFVNTSALTGSIITPINNIIDMVVDKLKQFSNAQMITAKNIFTPMVDGLNKMVEKYEKELETLDYQIDEIKKSADSPQVKAVIDQIENNDTTTKAVLSINPNTGNTTTESFASTYTATGQEIDYDKILNVLDQLSQYDNNFVSLESLSEEYGAAYQSGGTLRSTSDGTLTYDKFVQICNEMNCIPKTEVFDTIMVAFDESLRSLTINNYDKTADLAAYLANTSIECGFNAVREYSKYSERAIMNTWCGSYFNSDGSPIYKTIQTDVGIVYTKTAAQYASDGENLFNYVYGTSKGKLGRLGNNSWGDGYKYRGGGFTQLTFKSNYESYDKFCSSYFYKNFNITANPDNINNVAAAVYTSIAYWINRNGTRNLHNVWTTNPDIAEEVNAIQLNRGSMPCTSSKYPGIFKNGISETQRKFTACYALVAGSYPTDNSSDTAKTTYIKKLSAFKRIYGLMTT